MNRAALATAIGVATAMLATFAAVKRGDISPTFVTANHVTIPWPSGISPTPNTTMCAQCDMIYDADTANVLNIPVPANPKYVTIRTCGDPAAPDAGYATAAHARALRTLKAIDHECTELPWQTGWPQTELWVSGTAGDPSSCRCSNGSTCTFVAGGAVAPKNRTYQTGVVTGAGCRVKACTELAGFPTSMPAACQ